MPTPRWLLPLPLIAVGLLALPAAALTSGSVSLSYSAGSASDSADVTAGGPPEEGNPPLPIDLTLTTPDVGGLPADPFVGLHGAVEAHGPGGAYVQSVGAVVGGVPFETPFGGTNPDTIVWSNDPVGSGPYEVSATATVSQEVRYQVVDQALSVSFEWNGGLFFFANNFGPGEYEYGYSFSAQVFSTVEDGFYGSFPSIGALGGPALTVSGSGTLSQPNEDFPGGFDDVGVYLTNPGDVGNFMRIALHLEVWIAGNFSMGQYGMVQNLVDFSSTLGATSVDGAVVAVPEPGVSALAVVGLLGLARLGRRSGRG